nr:MAG TPA: hypothetical protein [Caudoviricetes sp.]
MKLILRVDVIVHLQRYGKSAGNLGLINRLVTGAVHDVFSRRQPVSFVCLRICDNAEYSVIGLYRTGCHSGTQISVNVCLIFFHNFFNFIIFHQTAADHVSASRAVSSIDSSLRLITAAIKIFNYKSPVSVFGRHAIRLLPKKNQKIFKISLDITPMLM